MGGMINDYAYQCMIDLIYKFFFLYIYKFLHFVISKYFLLFLYLRYYLFQIIDSKYKTKELLLEINK